MKFVEKHIRDVRVGDVIFHDGKVKTLDEAYLKRGGFEGDRIWGDSYHAGNKPVKVVVINSKPAQSRQGLHGPYFVN